MLARQIIFTVSGIDIRNFLVASHEALLTITVEYGVYTMRFPSSIWFPIPQHSSICVTAPVCPFQYYVAVTPLGACIRCNVPTFLFNLVASHTGLSFA